jgi:hypothetical protein
MSLDKFSSFYVALDDGRFAATAATAGPWGPALQHGGPPSALAVRALERLPGTPGLRLARITVDILRPVPVAPLTVATRVLRPGRRVELVEATVTVEGQDEPALRVTAWRVAAAPDAVPAVGAAHAPPPFPGPQPRPTAAGHHLDGYMSAVEWRFADGAFDVPGPAAAWARSTVPLVAGEELSAPQRTVLLADSGNGVGTSVDRARWLSINTDLAVSLYRDPAGEWLCLRSRSTITPGACATTETLLFDRAGAVGRATQTLLVDDLGAG